MQVALFYQPYNAKTFRMEYSEFNNIEDFITDASFPELGVHNVMQPERFWKEWAQANPIGGTPPPWSNAVALLKKCCRREGVVGRCSEHEVNAILEK